MSGSSETLTTAEARRRYEAACDVLDRMCERGAANVWRMRIPAQPNDTDLVLGDALLALRELIEERDENAELRTALREWSEANRACSQWVAGTVGNDEDELPLARLSRAERHLHALAGGEEQE